MRYIFICSLLLFATITNAQFGKRLKEKAKEAAARKANQKADEAINKGADKIDSVIAGKKRDKTNNKKTTDPASDNTSSSDNNGDKGTSEAIYKEVIIKTNVRCETGKKKLEAILKNTDGVSSVMIDNDNGNLYLSSENADVSSKVIELIRQNGFEADGKKPIAPGPDPCK